MNSVVQNDVIPKFLHFKLANNRLRSSKVYQEIQLKLLKSEINHHRCELRETVVKLENASFEKCFKMV